jgi:membrane protein required for colicin V production
LKIIDIILILILLFGAYRGYQKGLLLEILTFLAFIIAIISAFHLLHSGVQWLSDYFSETKLLPYISFILIFLLVFTGIFFLSRVLKKIIDYTLLGSFDKYAGALLGTCQIAFAVSMVLWLSHNAHMDLPRSYTNGTFLYPNLVAFAPKIVSWVSYVIPFQDIFPAVKRTIQG